jgi:hypothetical protein
LLCVAHQIVAWQYDLLLHQLECLDHSLMHILAHLGNCRNRADIGWMNILYNLFN